MPFYYTPFPKLLAAAIRHGGGQCASTNCGQCLQHWPEIAVVAHGNPSADFITDNSGNYLSGKELLKQMRMQGLSDRTTHIFLHACNAGGGKFEEMFQKALRHDNALNRIEVTGYGGKVGLLDGVPAIAPAVYREDKRGHRHAHVG